MTEVKGKTNSEANVYSPLKDNPLQLLCRMVRSLLVPGSEALTGLVQSIERRLNRGGAVS